MKLGRGEQLALWLLVTLRIGFGLVAVVSVLFGPAPAPAGGWPEQVIRDGEPWSLFLSTWQRWDAIWYQRISEDGYRPGDGTVRFMPLYPLLVRAVALPLGGFVVPLASSDAPPLPP